MYQLSLFDFDAYGTLPSWMKDSMYNLEAILLRGIEI